MIRTIFWSDRTFCIVKFDSAKFPSPASLCRALKRKSQDIYDDREGVYPTYYLLKNNRWFKNPAGFVEQKHSITADLGIPMLDINEMFCLGKVGPYDNYFMPGISAEQIMSEQRLIFHTHQEQLRSPKPKQIHVTIYWLHDEKEIVKAEDHPGDPHKTISNALYNGGYSQAAVHSIDYWSKDDSCVRYTFNKETFEWVTS